MAITYPRILDDSGMAFQSVTFELIRSTIFTALRSGAAQRVEVAPPRWRARFTTTQPRNINEFDRWMAFLDTLQGGLKVVRAGDPTRAAPAAHPNRSGLGTGWDGTATLDGRGAGALVVNCDIAGVRNNLQMTPGDMVVVSSPGAGRRLFRLTDTAQPNPSTFLMNMSVEPRVDMNAIAPGDTVIFYAPRANFVLDPESIQADKSTDFPAISFALIQVIG